MARLVVSLNERLMLHLLEMEKYREDADVPLGASQEGIAQRLGTQVHSVSRALASLQSEGLVSGRLAHIRGAPKRRKAYFLTDNGRKAAQSIKADISGRRIALEQDGRAVEVSFEEAVRRIVAVRASLSFLDAVDAGSSADVLHVSEFQKAQGVAPACEYVQRAHGRPKVEQFFGREKELKTILEALTGTDSSAVLLWGMPGIGKSTLASLAFDRLSGKRSVFWYSFREWDTDASFLGAIGSFLSDAGLENTISALDRRASAPDMFMPLLSDLAGHPVVLFLDDVHKPAGGTLPILPVLFDSVKMSQSSKLLLISRSVPEYFSRSEPGNTSVELGGLDRDSAWTLARSIGAGTTAEMQAAVDQSRGHPLLISLMVRGGARESKGDVIGFIEREIYSKVSPEERWVLETLSVFRHPVPVDALGGVDYSVISTLRKKALVTESEDGVSTHDLLREFFRSHMRSEQRLALHRAAGAYCERREETEWKLETFYHYVEAGDWTDAKRISTANAVELSKDFPEETLELISRIPANEGSASDRAGLVFLRGQLKESLGKKEAALSDFQESLALLGGEGDAVQNGLVLEAVARLQSEVSRWADSLAAHEKALALYIKSGDRQGEAREWMNIGGVHRRRGDLKKAREAYQKALSIATREEDRPSQAACMNNLALLDRDEGRLRDAELKLKESIGLAHAVKDQAGEARGLENLAELFRMQLRSSEVIDLLLESAEAYRRAGELVESKRMQAACAESMGDQGRYDDAVRMLRKGLESPEFRRRRGLFQKAQQYDAGDLALSSTLADLLRRSGEPKLAVKEVQRYDDMAKTIGDLSAVAKGRLLMSIIREDMGELDLALEALKEAETMLRSEGNLDGLIAVHIRAGGVQEKRGDSDSAKRHYEEAARHSETTGNRLALSLALENLRDLSDAGGS